MSKDKQCSCGECSCGDGGQRVNLELNLGAACNFRCRYCFEAGSYDDAPSAKVTTETLARFIEMVRTMVDHDVHVSISFWGGEPLLYMAEASHVLNALVDLEGVDCLLYTNGWYLQDHSMVLAKHIDEWGERLHIQVSHDFLPTELSNRVLPGVPNEEVERRVLDAIRWLDTMDASFSIKSTSTLDDLEHNVFQQFMNFLEFRDQLVHKERITFGSTPDTTDTRATDKTLVGQQMNKLLVYFAEHRMVDPLFNWFAGDARKICSAGNRSCLVDVNGDVVPCHGCLYYVQRAELASKVRFANIDDPDILFKIEHSFITRRQLSRSNAECQACDAVMCFRCNAVNCRGDLERWDACNAANTCDTYRFISRYVRAYHVMRDRWLAEQGDFQN